VSERIPSELGALPPDWRTKRFDSLFAVQQGKQVSKKNRIGGNQCSFLRTKNVFWGRLDLSELDEMNFTEAEEKRLALHRGDLLTCEGGDIGRTAIWNAELDQCYYQNHLHRARLRNGDASSQFVMFWLWYAFEIGSVYFGRGNVTTIPNLSQSRLSELPLPVPPLSEQQKIAAVLELVQRAMQKQERLLALAAELKKALLSEFFTRGLRNEPEKQSELGPIPQSWEITPLGKYCSVQSGFAFKSSDYVASDSGLPIIKIGDLQNGEVVLSERSSFVPWNFWEEKFARNFRLGRGDLLIALTGATTGKTAEFRLESKALLNQRVGRFLPDGVQLKPAFLKNLILQPYFQREIQRNILAAAQGNVSPKRIEQFLVAVPAPSEQEEIGIALEALDRKISNGRRKRTALSALFRTLLHELMTARIRVHNFDLSAIEMAAHD
jgi:type I restriction enzyme S subunit